MRERPRETQSLGFLLLIPLILLSWYHTEAREFTLRIESAALIRLLGEKKALDIGQEIEHTFEMPRESRTDEVREWLEPIRIGAREMVLRVHLIGILTPLWLPLAAGFFIEAWILGRIRAYEFALEHPLSLRNSRMLAQVILILCLLLLILPLPMTAETALLCLAALARTLSRCIAFSLISA